MCLTLCDPIEGSPPGSPVPGILQARTLEWVAIYFSNAWKWKVKVKLLSRVQLLATPWTGSPPGSSIHGIFQARVLEWGAIAFSMIYILNALYFFMSLSTIFDVISPLIDDCKLQEGRHSIFFVCHYIVSIVFRQSRCSINIS